MSLICHSCTGEISTDHVTCQGFCKATFHVKCSGLSTSAHGEASNHRQLFYFCNSCTNLMSDMRLRGTIRTAYEAGQENVLGAHNVIVENLKLEIMSELKKEIRSNFAVFANSNCITPKSSKRTDPTAIRSRRLFDKRQPHRFQEQPIACGTAESISPSLGVVSLPANQPKFWLYLSRISRDVTIEQIRGLAQKRLGSDDITVIRLVAKDRDINTLSFVSFKIGMSADLKDKGLSPSTWPKGLQFREFRDNRLRENFWKPEKTPNPRPSTTPTDHVHPSEELVMSE